MASEAIEELPASIDTAIARSEEILPVTTKMVVQTVPSIEQPTQIDEDGPS